MATYHGLTAKVRPAIHLNEIVIKLDPFGPPVVELRGRVKTGNRRVDTSTEITIRTAALGPNGAAFIREMKEAFGDPEPEPPEGVKRIGRR